MAQVTRLTATGLPGSAALVPSFLAQVFINEGLYGPVAQPSFTPPLVPAPPAPAPNAPSLPYYVATYSQLKIIMSGKTTQAIGWATDLNQLMFYSGNPLIGDQGWESLGV